MPTRTRSAIARDIENAPSDSDGNSDIEVGDVDAPTTTTYPFEGRIYDTYQEMVNAKRKRNLDWMEDNGLLKASNAIKQAKISSVQDPGGLTSKKKRKQVSIPTTKRRKSNRLAGVHADGRHVEEEKGGKFRIMSSGVEVDIKKDEEDSFYNNRINNGDDLSIKEAVELCGEKWTNEESVVDAENFAKKYLRTFKSVSSIKSPTSSEVESGEPQRTETFSVGNTIRVTKVTPDRIYSIACHPSHDSVIVGAGDKLGHVGLWNVADDNETPAEESVHLFRPHSRPICCMEWTSSGSGLLTASYDGSVRWFDVESQKFSQQFATYDSSECFKEELGYGMDRGSRSWVQHCTGDFRFDQEKCFFLSTSLGNVLHVDLRTNASLTFDEQLSEKKINTVSLHPNGYTLATAGLDCTVKIWDLRRAGDSRNKRKGGAKSPSAVAHYRSIKSINSAFFSPSGTKLLVTTMADTLELFANPQLSTGTLSATKKIAHNNHTGRWLSTFMARWHESTDVFVVGSMQQPRSIEVFDGSGNMISLLQGEGLTAVASRCCFHSSTERMLIVGGNSSGRVYVGG